MSGNRAHQRGPLARVRGLGSAKTGTEHWWHQRLTAVALVPLVLAFSVLILRLVGADWPQAAQTMGQPAIALLALLAVAVGFWHLKLGLQVVIEDYVHHEGGKLVAQVAVNFACVAIALAGIMAIAAIAARG